ncbi:MAG: DUF3945 domain-containing protein [Chryseobacterium sp.]|nr:MAG: DUF3945 domain-containing protein [Chryseobacterium sp.]
MANGFNQTFMNENRFDLEQIRNAYPLSSFLHQLGQQPKRYSGGKHFYHSMLRDGDRNPSFCANDKLGFWYIEYDPVTKDFVGYDVSGVQTPERINGMLLGEEEKSAFKRGELIELTDGTRVQHRASDPKGIRSDRKALVLSVLLDGGIRYLLIRGIQSLRDGAIQVNHRSAAFNQALEEMQGAKKIDQWALQTDINQYLGPKKITRH